MVTINGGFTFGGSCGYYIAKIRPKSQNIWECIN